MAISWYNERIFTSAAMALMQPFESPNGTPVMLRRDAIFPVWSRCALFKTEADIVTTNMQPENLYIFDIYGRVILKKTQKQKYFSNSYQPL